MILIFFFCKSVIIGCWGFCIPNGQTYVSCGLSRCVDSRKFNKSIFIIPSPIADELKKFISEKKIKNHLSMLEQNKKYLELDSMVRNIVRTLADSRTPFSTRANKV